MDKPYGFDFSVALGYCKGGSRIARSGWNGKHMFVFFVDGGEMAVRFPDDPVGVRRALLPHLILHTAQGELVPWLASQTDMLANDWAVV